MGRHNISKPSKEDAIAYIFRMLICIPYLPEHEIERGFENVREQAEKIKDLTRTERRNLDLSISYVKCETGVD